MRNRIALLALALAAIAPAAASAQANAPGAPGAPLPPVYGGVPAMGHLRDSWYIGFGLGPAAGNVTVDGSTVSLHDVLAGNGADSTFTGMLKFEVGATIRPDLLLGLDLNVVRAQGSSSTIGGDVGVSVVNVLGELTWFPVREGFFLRGGAGVASITLDAQSGGATASETHTGVGVLGGLGYAFWLGQRFNLSLNLDVSAQFYGGGAGVPESSRTAALYAGFSWY